MKKMSLKVFGSNFSKNKYFLYIQKHMKRTDGSFPTRLKTSKTDQYAKSYPDFSLGGNQLGEHSLLLISQQTSVA